MGVRLRRAVKRGSRAELSHAKLERSAAVRGQGPREVGVQGEETHNLLRSLHVDHAASWSASAGVRYPSEECSRCRL